MLPYVYKKKSEWIRPNNSKLNTRLRAILFSNLNCFQIVTNGYTIGKLVKNYQQIQSSFYHCIYQGILYINFFWTYHCLKKVIYFFFKLSLRQHIFLGGGTFNLPAIDGSNSSMVNELKIEELLSFKDNVRIAWLEGIYLIATRKWIKGFLSNKQLTQLQLKLKSKFYLKRSKRSLSMCYPTAAFFINQYKHEIAGLLTEVNNTNIPSLISFDTNVNISKLKFFYFLPVNTKSFNLFLNLSGICLYSKFHSYLTRSKFLYPLLDSNQYLYKKNRF